MTRKIGEAQVRAYLTCNGGSYTVEKDKIICEINFTNHGQSPARLDCPRGSDARRGALPRFFWPVKKDCLLAATRGKRLRDAFGFDDASPLKWRKLRNAFEHFDEELDRFLLTDRVGCFFPSPLVAEHTLADEVIGNIFKLVDPKHGICVLLGEKFEFRQIRREVQRVLARALEMDEQGSRL